jgi:hypothetical protein
MTCLKKGAHAPGGCSKIADVDDAFAPAPAPPAADKREAAAATANDEAEACSTETDGAAAGAAAAADGTDERTADRCIIAVKQQDIGRVSAGTPRPERRTANYPAATPQVA